VPAAPGASSTKPAPGAAATPRDDRKAKAGARQRLADTTRPWRTEVAQIDKRLASLAAERAEVEARLGDPSTAPADFAELGRRLNHIAAETSMLEERWLELHTRIEAAQAEAS
jgi:ATP-binding cassette subfamily F protein 3